jgi:hypothetical protein
MLTRNTLWGEEEVTATRVCNKCGEEKHEDDFAYRYSGNNGIRELRNDCKKCQRYQTSAVSRLKKLYPPPDKHTYCCPICNRTKEEMTGFKNNPKQDNPFVLDHDHKTGKARGYICNYCNVAISRFNEDIQAMYNAIKYLQNNGVEGKHYNQII